MRQRHQLEAIKSHTKQGNRTSMDELQDAIEDAQYVNAMHDDTPRPTKDWKVLESYVH